MEEAWKILGRILLSSGCDRTATGRGSLTEADVKAARIAQAKRLHPDVAASPRQRLWGVGLLDGGGAAARRRRREHERMSALNAAHDAVRKAIGAPMYW